VPIRTRNGREVVTTRPQTRAQGRRAPLAPAVRSNIDPRDPGERLAHALVDQAVAHAQKDNRAREAAKDRAQRAREALRELPDGRNEVERITTGLSTNGGAMLRSVAIAHVDSKEYAARAAVRYVAWLREHAVECSSALVMLASAAQWTALGEMLRDRTFATDPATLTAVRGRTDGMQSVRMSSADTLKLAERASSAGRLDLMAGLALEQQARDARKAQPILSADVQARMRAVVEGRAQREAAAEKRKRDLAELRELEALERQEKGSNPC
jgi:hypothetical protein